VGGPLLEPAERAGAGAAQHDAAIPRLPEDDVDPLRLPDRLLIERVAARADDAVDAEEYVFPAAILAGAGDEADLVRGFDFERRAGLVPRNDPLRGIGGGTGQVQQLRPRLAGELGHVADEQRVVVAAGDQNLARPGARSRLRR